MNPESKTKTFGVHVKVVDLFDIIGFKIWKSVQICIWMRSMWNPKQAVSQKDS